ncbi:hypothetical protein BK816_05930 [Boudabousia tangfeifanii]|uniref:Biotin transporter n=1 Tax=Boudabousia tangfeifanii TaxID=1912795 RepID=A0A1D9MKX4_9ACTO|nr:biotin transporter BioY [Boudabousia tangfeifanii]AOZ72888.1 hypothetical protein BK816_05930 [Boudabousia tangfeifanii]
MSKTSPTLNKSLLLSEPVLADRWTLGSLSKAARELVLVIAGASLVGAFAQLSVPMWPVPVTAQTLAVMLVGAAFGLTRGAITLASYLGLGLLVVPWFANFTGGSAAIFKPSFGFIIGFILMAALVGFGAQRGWDRRLSSAFLLFLGANVALYVFGLAYLWVALAALGKTLSLSALLKIGLLPFVPGDLLKTVLAAALSPLAWKLVGAKA